MSLLLQGRTAVITGATRGIGKAVALTLAEQGANLVVNGTREDLLQALAEEIGADRCAACPGSVTDPATAARLAKTALERFGRIDILVNNAGINERSPTLEMTLENWRAVMDVNLDGTLHACRAVLPVMIEQGYGKIVNVSSTTGKTPHKNAAPSYGASKAAVNYLTRHLALEMAGKGIHVNAVCPGPVETGMSAQWSEEYRARVLAGIPLGRLGQPKDVADTVLFLACAMSDFITGETINVNGGTYMN